MQAPIVNNAGGTRGSSLSLDTKLSRLLSAVFLLAIAAMCVERNQLNQFQLWMTAPGEESAAAAAASSTSSATASISQPSSSSSSSSLFFEQAFDIAFQPVLEEAATRLRHRHQNSTTRTSTTTNSKKKKKKKKKNNNNNKAKRFDVSKWTRKTWGGLDNYDRVKLVEIYGKADSIFEFGLGESTYIADWLNVSRYSGVDSDVRYVDTARQNVSSHFRFYYADMGNTGAWGYPEDRTLKKDLVNYQMGALKAEPLPFDVYMVDGRYRLPLLLLSFLHASSRGAQPDDTTVLLHDCYAEGHSLRKLRDGPSRRENYHKADHILEMVDHSQGLLCVYKRKNTTTDKQIFDLWNQYFTELE